MIRFISWLLFAILTCLMIPMGAYGCTAFLLDTNDGPLYGRNFDWRIGEAYVVINKRGTRKKAIPESLNHPENSLQWTSQYGSATFNLIGREFPMGGMNEAGLVIESLMLDQTRYPPLDSRLSLLATQWMQYHLDNAATVKEVIDSEPQVRIRGPRDSKFHFFICDRSSVCAAIEFIEGKQITHTNEKLPVKVLTNTAYQESLTFLKQGKLPEPDYDDSVARFIRSAKLIKEFDPHTEGQAIAFAFNILKEAEHDSHATQWSIVYDPKALTIHFRTLQNQQIRSFTLQSFDLSCSKPVKVMSVETKMSGDITNNFANYSHQVNRNHMRYYFVQSYFAAPPDRLLERFSDYPESTSCNE